MARSRRPESGKMIVKKLWIESKPNGTDPWEREGWFLFGIIPLYVRDLTFRNHSKVAR